ncbi:hypothetical protein VTN77DRAFT_1424 [Rasamsonia byssochlamydoides]|uniref:uncharacterized protein n=1 Tax=Rasamsonia byssochlamydoides TaxID=89139 RepID=UPI003742D3C4
MSAREGYLLASAAIVASVDASVELIMKNFLRYCEDVVLDHEQGLAIVSCDPGRPKWNTVMNTMYDPNPKGGIFVYDYVHKNALRQIRLLGFPSQSDFHPLGINIYREKGGSTRLFVVNHQRNGSTVDIFDIDYVTSTATFITSIADNDRHILSPNAVSPVSYTSFFVTNDHRFIPRKHAFLNMQETTRALPLGWVTFVDFSCSPTRFHTAISGIPFPNGIVVTPTGKEVIVASSSTSHLLIYDRDPISNCITYREKIPLQYRPDNLTFDHSLKPSDPTAFDKDGRFLRGLVSAGHPCIRLLHAMSRDPSKHAAPSWVVEIRRTPGKAEAPCKATTAEYRGDYYVETLYQSDGSHFPSSTTGAMDNQRGELVNPLIPQPEVHAL